MFLLNFPIFFGIFLMFLLTFPMFCWFFQCFLGFSIVFVAFSNVLLIFPMFFCTYQCICWCFPFLTDFSHVFVGFSNVLWICPMFLLIFSNVFVDFSNVFVDFYKFFQFFHGNRQCFHVFFQVVFIFHHFSLFVSFNSMAIFDKDIYYPMVSSKFSSFFSFFLFLHLFRPVRRTQGESNDRHEIAPWYMARPQFRPITRSLTSLLNRYIKLPFRISCVTFESV